MYRTSQRLRNEMHDHAYEIASSTCSPMETPYVTARLMSQQQQRAVPRPASPTPTSSSNNNNDDDTSCTSDTSITTSQYEEEMYYYRLAQQHQELEQRKRDQQQQQYKQLQRGAPSTRPVSPPSKQQTVPRASSSYSPKEQQQNQQREVPPLVTPSITNDALRELDENMDELYDNFPDTSSSVANDTLNRVCDKLELLSELVLKHERRLTQSEAALSPQVEQNKSLVHSILAKVDAVESMMEQVRAASAQASPAPLPSPYQQEQQQQQHRSPLATISSSALHQQNSSNQENITPARSEASAVIAATVESAMKSISRQLQRQNELLAQVVVNQAHQQQGSASRSNSAKPTTMMMAGTPYGDDAEDALAESTTASIADDCSPEGAELSPRRERTPEALAATCNESARRQLEALREVSVGRQRLHVDPTNSTSNYVVPPARLYDEYAYSGTETTENDDEDEDEEEDDDISVVGDVQEDDGSYYYDRLRQQKKLLDANYNVPMVGAGADIVSVASSEFEEEVAEEDGDNSSPRRAMFGAIDSVNQIRAAASPARNRGVIQAPQAVVFDNETEDEEEEEYTESDDDEDEYTNDENEQNQQEQTDTEDDEAQLAYAQHFSPSRRTPQVSASSTAAAMARRDEQELIATMRAKQQTQAYLEAAAAMSAERRRRTADERGAAATNSAGSSPASRASTGPATGRHGGEDGSELVEVEGLTPQPAYLLRSAIRNDAESAEKLPEKRVLFVEENEDDASESGVDDEDDEEEVEDESEQQHDDETSATKSSVTPSDMSYATASVTSACATNDVTTVPNTLLKEVIDELQQLRKENRSLKVQLDWALKRTDAVSERLLELSPCK